MYTEIKEKYLYKFEKLQPKFREITEINKLSGEGTKALLAAQRGGRETERDMEKERGRERESERESGTKGGRKSEQEREGGGERNSIPIHQVNKNCTCMLHF